MKLLVATKNRHKAEEIRDILCVPGLELLTALDLPGAPDVDEDGATFVANASKKAHELQIFSGMWTLADDSGLEVDALGGQPGVLSARYAGEPVSYAANNRKLLAELGGTSDRRARFRCVLALADPSGGVRTVEGTCEGRIIGEERGTQGFGYDPLFVPDGYSQTFAEMPSELKNRISHRARALQAAVHAWGEMLRNEA